MTLILVERNTNWRLSLGLEVCYWIMQLNHWQSGSVDKSITYFERSSWLHNRYFQRVTSKVNADDIRTDIAQDCQEDKQTQQKMHSHWKQSQSSSNKITYQVIKWSKSRENLAWRKGLECCTRNEPLLDARETALVPRGVSPCQSTKLPSNQISRKSNQKVVHAMNPFLHRNASGEPI